MKPSLVLIFSLVLLFFGSQRCEAQCENKANPKFANFPARLYDGKVHDPILSTNHQRMFRTRIQEAAKDGVNFAGHYVVASWGCGTGCTQFVVLDAITGAVAEPPFESVDFHYWLFLAKIPKWANYEPKWSCYDDFLTSHADSSLLVVEGCIRNQQCGRTFYEMKDGRLRQVFFDPDLLPDGTVALIGP